MQTEQVKGKALNLFLNALLFALGVFLFSGIVFWASEDPRVFEKSAAIGAAALGLALITITTFDPVVQRLLALLEWQATRPPKPHLQVDEVDVVDESYLWGKMIFDETEPSYHGFCAFCAQFLILEKRWDRATLTGQDPHRRFYCYGMSEELARFYVATAARAGLIRGRRRGTMGYLARGIATLQDVQMRVPYLVIPRNWRRKLPRPFESRDWEYPQVGEPGEVGEVGTVIDFPSPTETQQESSAQQRYRDVAADIRWVHHQDE